jgi:branched-subunit amino acid transport protein AzlD
METVLASAIFARAVLLLLRLLPWIELKSSRLREGIGRVGKIIGSSAYIFILFLFDFNSRL